MTNSSDKTRTAGQPDLSELFARYLHGQVGTQKAGLSLAITGEVVPHEAAPTQPADPKLAWEEALAVLPFYSPKVKVKTFKAPPDWSTLVAAQDPALAVPFCLGNFPQMVRSLQPLLHLNPVADTTRLAALGTDTSRLATPELIRWAEIAFKRKGFPENLLAVAALRLAREFDRAEALILKNSKVEEALEPAWNNERAALDWHRGRTKEALASWKSQEETVPVLFNRGIASLFMNQRANARAFLHQAVTHLSEDGAWHHLARLYLAMAEMKA